MQDINQVPNFDYNELLTLSFGELEGEDDLHALSSSFIITNSIFKLLRKNYNYILSPKGAGKSAIFNAFSNNLFDDELFKKDDYNIIAINDSFVFEHSYLNPDRFKHNLNDKNYTFAWGLYLCAKMIGNINDKYKGSIHYSKLLEKLRQVESFREDFDLYKIFDIIENLNLELNFSVNGQQLKLSPKLRSKKQKKKINLNQILIWLNEFYKSEGIKTLILVDRVDNFVGKDEYKIQKKYVEGLVSSIEEIRRQSHIQPMLFLRTDLYHSLSIRFEYDKAKARTLHLTWTHTEILRFIVNRLINNEYINKNYEPLLFQIFIEENNKKIPKFEFLFGIFSFLRPKRQNINLVRNTNHIIFERFIEVFFPTILNHIDDKGIKAEINFFEWIFTHFKDANGYINPRCLLYYFNCLMNTHFEAYDENIELQESDYHCKPKNGDFIHLNVFIPEVIQQTYNDIQNEELIGLMTLLSTKSEKDIFVKINDLSYPSGYFKYGDIQFKKFGLEKSNFDRLIKYLEIVGFCKLVDHQLYKVPILYQNKMNLECTTHNTRS